MPRKPLPQGRARTKYVQVMLTPNERKAFETWCRANELTMSEFLRDAMAKPIREGLKMLEES